MSIFDNYLDSPEPARARLRDELSQRDPELLRALLSMLRADGHPSALDIAPAELLARARANEPPPRELADPRVGTRLGAWQIDGVIAEGGMGTVYAAHRADGQYEQRAALKCVRAALASPALLQAFVAERNHLARLEHPGIATLLDGGVGEDGQPWFAMRYVAGIPVDAWCDSRNASVRERVDLLIQISDALSHAHAQGIVHRDIKPSNVLVTAEGRAYLVDFGIASGFTHPLAHEQDVAITPNYAAPEAREYGVHAPAGDLYALGVLTYRLLCGQWPLSLHGLRDLIPITPGEPRPMDALLKNAAATLAAQRGASSLACLRGELAGDLSAIALKAVATAPQDRYPSVAEFAEDLRGWREHRAVAAHPGSWLQRTRKWRRRNPLAALLALVLTVVAVTGLGLSARYQQRAARESASTEEVSALFASTLGTATLSGLGSAPFSSKALLAKTERELRKLPLRDRPALLGRALATLARSHAVIGDFRYAGQLADEAERIGGRYDEDGFIAALRVSLLNDRARHAEAATLATIWIEQLEDGETAQARSTRIGMLSELAVAQWGMAEPEQALRTLERAFAQLRGLPPGHQETTAQLLILRGKFRFRLMRFASAESDARQAIRLAEPGNPILADDAREKLVEILGWKVSANSVALAEQLLASRRRTLGERHPKTGRAWLLLAYAQSGAASKSGIVRGRELIAAAYGRDHPEYAFALNVAPRVMSRDSRELADTMMRVLDIRERRLGPRHELTLNAKRNVGMALIALEPSLRRRADEIRGIATLRQTLRERREAGLPTPLESLFLAHGLVLYGADADLPEAEALLRDTRADMRRYFTDQDAYPRETEMFWNKLLYRQGHRAQADRRFGRLLELEDELLRDPRVTNHNTQKRGFLIHESLLFRAFYAYETCRRAQALDYLRQAVEFDLRAFGADNRYTREARAFADNLQASGRMLIATGSIAMPAPRDEAMNRRARFCEKAAAARPANART